MRSIEFSGPTYQVEVFDPERGESLWPFLQFDEKGGLKDAFCSCDSQEEKCLHLQEALEAIFSGKEEPLHVRFARSFWHKLCCLIADQLGYVPKRAKGGFHLGREQLSCEIHPLTERGKQKLKEWIETPAKATPENSIKFSALPAQEIARWREGRPSPRVRYKLSFWSEIAKWMFLQEKYTVRFEEDARRVPTIIHLGFTELEMKVAINQEMLLSLIPYLSTIQSPLKVFGGIEEKIEAITFDPKEKAFVLQRTVQGEKKSHARQTPLDGWLYVAGEGFYSRQAQGLLAQETIAEVEELLDTHLETIAPHLKGVEITREPRPLRYTMRFDEKWRWHFRAYLFDPSDPITLYGRWAYINGKGFFLIEGALFDKAEATLEPSEVASFINGQRIWLSSQEGFATHLASVETSLSFEVDEKERLHFVAKHAESAESKDFGEWIYYKGEGFFSKRQVRMGLAVKAGMTVEREGVARFIDDHHDELEWIPNFFAETSPIEKRGLKATLTSQNALLITPFCEPQDPKLLFFGDYVFHPDRGFFKLSAPLRLPDGFGRERQIEQAKWPRFFDEEWPILEKTGITCDPSLLPPRHMQLHAHYLARRHEGGLRAELVYLTEQGAINVTEMQRAMNENRSFLFSEGGRIDLRQERFQWIKHLPPSPTRTVDLTTLDFLRIDALEGLGTPPDTAPTASITRALLSDLRTLRVTKTADTKGLKSTLRLYQQTGFQWLWFLYNHGLGGLLCDDMGLGKTHQAMALIAASLNIKEARHKRYLVVCPTSVIYHWEEKLATFLPGLKVHTFHGLKRSLKSLPKEGLILTTYGILRMEKGRLKEIRFEIAIFDEIQMAKNAHSRVHDALLTVDAEMRIGLTGTPIENRLLELKALLDIVLPGLMPGEKRFRELFVTPIERDLDEEKRALLSKLIHPFILRRRKQEVLEELPEKSEDKSYCDLSEEQKQLYIETLDQRRDDLISELRAGEAPVPYVHIFSVLSTLKQICDHPALIAKDPKNYKKYTAGKWDLFVELLDEARQSEQKVVVFSQYLYMLDIIELYLKEQGMEYAQIRGDTLDRREQLRRFQEDPQCVVFIGSLQAAGVGIDLTAASVVILYDRWWNAARENQAIDRVHRIGQKWGVQVFKLITKHTIEEKIDRLITKKGHLMERVITADDQAQLKTFSRSDLVDLLSYSE